ncbi:MAG TPA: phosphoadenosine phosphosulfate reductase family protein [Candidatus Acidoferrum sp.]|nr:phosphoadenosine phosphosulfate reductase family protein [Candidatus Acidoferrum sp.]
MKRVLGYSTGKDSTALVLWAKETFDPSEIIITFDDTIWEHELTYGYLAQMRAGDLLRGLRFERLNSKRYPGGLGQLVELKGRVPSPKARFCTSNLKIEPTIEFLKTIEDDYELYDGKRAQESESRASLPLRHWVEEFDCYVNHPLLYWTVDQVFAIAAKYDIPPNPLYLKGAGRVGCFPCVLINQRELKAYLADPAMAEELKARIYLLEMLCGRSFFEPTFIPERFCSGFDPKSGKAFPWADDVFRYIESVDADQLPMFEARSCMSVYNLCER